MKTSELVNILQAEIEKHGDQEVAIMESGTIWPIMNTNFITAYPPYPSRRSESPKVYIGIFAAYKDIWDEEPE